MLLALLILVPGRLGGPDPGPTLPFDTERLIAGGAARPLIAGGAEAGGALDPEKGASEIAEDTREDIPMRGAEVGPGGCAPLTDRGGPAALGGGGVAVGVGVLSAPPFLLIQRFNSGSYTKEDSSPNFARMGLFGDAAASVGSFFAPPNQPPRPQPFFAGAASFGRAAESFI